MATQQLPPQSSIGRTIYAVRQQPTSPKDSPNHHQPSLAQQVLSTPSQTHPTATNTRWRKYGGEDDWVGWREANLPISPPHTLASCRRRLASLNRPTCCSRRSFCCSRFAWLTGTCQQQFKESNNGREWAVRFGDLSNVDNQQHRIAHRYLYTTRKLVILHKMTRVDTGCSTQTISKGYSQVYIQITCKKDTYKSRHIQRMQTKTHKDENERCI